MICDLAEVYGIYDYKEKPPVLIATLAAGLREDSRTMMKLSDRKVTLNQLLLAKIADELGIVMWMKSEDGWNNRNRPPSILQALTGENNCHSSTVVGFESGEDFMRAREKLMKGAK